MIGLRDQKITDTFVVSPEYYTLINDRRLFQLHDQFRWIRETNVIADVNCAHIGFRFDRDGVMSTVELDKIGKRRPAIESFESEMDQG